MARMPGVAWHSVPHFSRGRGSSVNLIVIHQFAGGSVSAVQNWLRNPASQVSYSFGVGRNGETRQWVDTSDTPWATGNANSRSIAIGHEATNQPLTDVQMNATARIIRWAAGAHRQIPIRRVSNATEAGIGWHRRYMQTNCPGDPIIGQIAELVRRASSGTAPAPAPKPPAPTPPPPAEDDEMMLVQFGGNGAAGIPVPDRLQGSGRIRLGCTQGATVTIQFRGGGRNLGTEVTRELNWDGANGAAIPKDCSLVVLRRRDSGNAPVYATWA